MGQTNSTPAPAPAPAPAPTPINTLHLPYNGKEDCGTACIQYGFDNNFSTFARYPNAKQHSEVYKRNNCECDPKYENAPEYEQPVAELSLPYRDNLNCGDACIAYGLDNNFSTFAKYPEANDLQNKCECDPKFKNIRLEDDTNYAGQINTIGYTLFQHGSKVVGGRYKQEFENMTYDQCSEKTNQLNGNGFTTTKQTYETKEVQDVLSFKEDSNYFATINGISKHGHSINGHTKISFSNISPNECYWKNESLQGDGYTTCNFNKGDVSMNETTKFNCDVYFAKPYNTQINTTKSGKCIVHFNYN